MAVRLLGDAGIGWHIRNGQQILQTHSIPHTDSFSSTMNGQPWYAWEWLYDVVIAAAHDWLSLNGVVFFTAAVIAVTFALVYRLMLRRGGNLLVAMILLVLSIGASSVHFLSRPHVLSWLFTVIWFQLLESSEADASKKRYLFCLPVLMLFWVNLHGGFLVGFALLALYLMGGWLGRRLSSGHLKRLAVVTGLSLVATLVNPYGYQLHVHLYQYLSNGFLMSHIEEFRSPNFHGVAQQCFLVLLLITIVALAGARGKLRPSQLLVIVFAAASGLYATRNLPASSMLLTLTVAPLLSRMVAEGSSNERLWSGLRRFLSRCTSFASRMGNLELNVRGHLWPVLAIVFGVLVCAHGGKLGSRQLMDAHFDAKRFPVQAVGVIEERGMHDPIFCPDTWGGYLIYRLYPRIKVVVDDRHDLYGEQFLKDYLKVTWIAPGWEEVLNKEHINWVLVPTRSTLANMLRVTPKWTILHEDETAVLFQREGS